MHFLCKLSLWGWRPLLKERCCYSKVYRVNCFREKFVLICFIFTRNFVALITRLGGVFIFGSGLFHYWFGSLFCLHQVVWVFIMLIFFCSIVSHCKLNFFHSVDFCATLFGKKKYHIIFLIQYRLRNNYLFYLALNTMDRTWSNGNAEK